MIIYTDLYIHRFQNKGCNNSSHDPYKYCTWSKIEIVILGAVIFCRQYT